LGPSGQPYCEDISTFYARHFEDGAKTAHGQCKPSVSPGAFYTKPGDKAADGKSDKSWSCWSSDFAKFNRNDQEAKKQGFEGACEMRDWDSGIKPDQVPYCSTKMHHHPASCTPGPQQYWGACWSKHTENWLCIPKDSELIPGYALGDCKSSVPIVPVTSAPTPWFFDGACRFEEEHPKTYKCDTVPTYHEGVATTCGQRVDVTDDKACFSLIDGSQWSCIGIGEDFDTVPPCSWTKDPKGTENQPFYKGRCVFKRDKDLYDSALDASNLTMIDVVKAEMFV